MPASTAPKRIVRPKAAKSDGAAPALQSTSANPISEEQIAERAYHLWLSEGCPDGRALDHWMQAQQELTHP